MAIAPLEEPRDTGQAGDRSLRLIRGGRPSTAAPRGAALHARRDHAPGLSRSRASHPAAQRVPATPVPGRPESAVATDADVRAQLRAAVRAQTLARRRRTVAVVVVVVALGLLAMPLRALGAVTLDGRVAPAGVPAGLAPGSVVVVQQGDTIASIAARIDPAGVAATERALAASLGSATVVPGEHVVVP